MSNDLKTVFSIDDSQAGRAADSFKKRLENLNTQINNLDTQAFSQKNAAAFNDLTKRVDSTKTAFQKLSQTKLEKNQFDLISQGAFVAEKQATRLGNQLRSLRKEAADPANAQFGKYYTQAIREAETELEKLERKQASLIRQQRSIVSSGPGFGGAGNGSGNGSFSEAFGSRVFGSASGGLTDAFAGGLAGGAVVAGISAAESVISSLLSEVKDLSVESIYLAANFEETTNSVAVFAGSTTNALDELKTLDELALNTNGLRLETAEEGFRRLRALGFQAKIADDLITGLGKNRLLSGAPEQNVQRVITHFEQIEASPETAGRDLKFIMRDIPTLRNNFIDAFGTSSSEKLKKLVQANPEEFFTKLAASMANTQQAQAGLNVTIEKGKDALVEAGREFGKPFLSPITHDVKDLTAYLRENKSALADWGQTLADTYRGISQNIKEVSGERRGSKLLNAGRVVAAWATSGFSEGLIYDLNNAEAKGRALREKEELEKLKADFAKDPSKLPNAGNPLASLLNSLQGIKKTVEDTPSLDKQLETEKAEKAAEKVKAALAELTVKTALDDVSQNLELNKAITVRNAKGDSLKILRESAELEISALKQQIVLSDKLAAAKTQHLTSDEFNAGQGTVISRENAANIAKLQNQILLTQANAQNEAIEKVKTLKTEFRDFFVAAKTDNPFVKLLSDIDTIEERLKKFAPLGKDAINAASNVERERLLRQLSELRFTTNLQALKSTQEARQLDQLPQTQRFEFTRALETLEKKVDFAVKMIDLNRQIDEAGYYANKFNPNDPKSYDRSRFSFAQIDRFAETAGNRRRGESDADYTKRRQEAVDSGIKIQDAYSSIKDLKNIGLDGTGVYGRSALADKILERIPSREELLKRLSSPYAAVREQAQYLLSEQATALGTKRDLERQKFRDYFEQQNYTDLRRTDAREQLGLLKNSTGLSREFELKNFLSITRELGVNNLDGNLLAGMRAALLESSTLDRKKEEEARAERDAQRQRDQKFDAVLENITKLFGAKGLKVELGDQQLVYLKIETDDGVKNTRTLGSSGTPEDVARTYNEYQDAL